MREELLNLIPDELLNLIWRHVKPDIKYNLNKKYFYLFYFYRFSFINDKSYFRYKPMLIFHSYYIKNFNYIKYLIIHDVQFIIENIFFYRKHNDFEKFIYDTPIIFENKNFKNFVDFCYYYSKKYNSRKILNYINFFIRKYKLVDLIKKEHKNNNKITNRLTKWKI